jgi:hypothetical protein
MTYYALLYFIPALVAMGIAKVYFNYTITWREFAIQAVGTLAVIFVLFQTAGYSITTDTQLVNGVVTDLRPIQQSCPVGWRDFRDDFCTEYTTRTVKRGESCSTSSNGTRTCTPIYDTEYRYIFPWERRYFVISDVPQNFEIDRVDRQGVNTPERFSQVRLGDPVTVSRSYTNYIRGASASLFNDGDPTGVVPIPYPWVQDYYYANRLIVDQYSISEDVQREWNQQLAQLNADIRKTGANVIVVVTGSDETFATELARAWESHNINDVVVSIGMSADRVAWVDVRSWSATSRVELEIKNRILELGTLDNAAINAIIQDSVERHYTLQDMKEFEYLADEMTPPTWAIIVAGILLLIVSPFVTYYLHRNDVA